MTRKANIEPWIRERRNPDIEEASLKTKLLKEKKITIQFLNQLDSLSLEDIIALKLQIVSDKTNNKFFGFRIRYVLREICEDALVKFAFSNFDTSHEIQAFFGLSSRSYSSFMKKYYIDEYFSDFINKQKK